MLVPTLNVTPRLLSDRCGGGLHASWLVDQLRAPTHLKCFDVLLKTFPAKRYSEITLQGHRKGCTLLNYLMEGRFRPSCLGENCLLAHKTLKLE